MILSTALELFHGSRPDHARDWLVRRKRIVRHIGLPACIPHQLKPCSNPNELIVTYGTRFIEISADGVLAPYTPVTYEPSDLERSLRGWMNGGVRDALDHVRQPEQLGVCYPAHASNRHGVCARRLAPWLSAHADLHRRRYWCDEVGLA